MSSAAGVFGALRVIFTCHKVRKYTLLTRELSEASEETVCTQSLIIEFAVRPKKDIWPIHGAKLLMRSII